MLNDIFEILDSNANSLFEQMKEKFEEFSGREISKYSPESIIFATVAYSLSLREEKYNDLIKQNYLKFAREKRLDLLGEHYGNRGLRLKKQSAKATFRFYIISAKLKNIIVPKGSLIRYGDLYFATDEEYIIKPNDLYVDGVATCTTPGTIANNINLGNINTMVDIYPYYSKVENITVTNGGTDEEEDDEYRARLKLVPDSFSTAGPEKSYIFWALSTSPDIIDSSIKSDNPCEVDVYILTRNGIPSEELKSKVLKNINSDDIRPLTDKVKVKDPVEISYHINLDYYIYKEDELYAGDIQKKVKKIVDEYIEWQKEKLGRDIIPDELIKRLKLVGVKRIILNSPGYQKIEINQFAKATSISINYLGVEDI